ncbi:calcium-binding protein [Shimia thalassica]|uniref:calcium-binding protein n=1 Tax=Shimia thalassica TaxID=1715693 RepID=UPI0026E42ADB|nr:calcium-binding protein [Shimia thalassica]MDO6523862.1 calcium-binding protein [Shimia thalassica]
MANFFGTDETDTLVGGAEDDFLTGYGNVDRIVGGPGNDTIVAGLGADHVWGGGGQDVFQGRFQDWTNDRLYDFSVEDVIYIPGTEISADQIDIWHNWYNTESADFVRIDIDGDGSIQYGTDAYFWTYVRLPNYVFSITHQDGGSFLRLGSVTAVDLAGDAGDNLLEGTAGIDTLSGLGGDDTLSGDLGVDILAGGGGNDTYFIRNPLVDITELAGEGHDHVITLGNSFNLPDHVEDLTIRREGGANTTAFAAGNALDNLIHVENEETDFTNYYEILGNGGNDTLIGAAGDDRIIAGDQNDSLVGNAGNDFLHGRAGSDTLIGGDGDDVLFGGAQDPENEHYSSVPDLGDELYGMAGDDNLIGAAGNDLLYGGHGRDWVSGGYGADTLVGQQGNDTLSGGVTADEIHGNDGNDFINGGFGFDRVNGGDGADKFFHVGVAGHGSDWIQDYDAAEGDILFYGGGLGVATADDFMIQRANTANAGDAGVDEIFVTHIPSDNILWALVDGDAQSSINLQIGGEVFDLLA